MEEEIIECQNIRLNSDDSTLSEMKAMSDRLARDDKKTITRRLNLHVA